MTTDEIIRRLEAMGSHEMVRFVREAQARRRRSFWHWIRFW